MKFQPKQFLAGAFALGIALSASAQVDTTSLVGWSVYGDVVSQSGAITLTTAYTEGDDQPFNLSGQGAADIATLEAAAGVAPYGLDLSDVEYGTEGSLVAQTFAGTAGATLSFDWSFSTLDTTFQDRAFVVINGVVHTLATASAPGAATQSFAFQLAQSGPIDLAVGVIDTADYNGVSTLSISKLQLLTPVGAVPEPATHVLLLAGAGLLWVVGRKHRRNTPNGVPVGTPPLD